MTNRAGAATIVLHTHLPWVLHHGRWPHGSDWLCEAVAECYLPLLRVLEPRTRAGRTLGITIDVSPVLCDQLDHPDLAGEFRFYCDGKRAAAEVDARRFARHGADREAAQAQRWIEFYSRALEEFGARGGILRRLRALEEAGAIEIAGTSATHAYLPLLGTPGAVARQVAVAVDRHRRHFGRAPRGFWLPECAFRPAGRWQSPLRADDVEAWRAGIESVLASRGIEYFFVERHLIEGGRAPAIFSRAGAAARPQRARTIRDAEIALGGQTARTRRAARGREPAAGGPATPWRAERPYRVGDSGLVAFGRDAATSEQVWSRDGGYPGNPAYLDFHRMHDPGGLRYWAVTDARGELDAKLPYEPEAAAARVHEHAAHFLSGIAETLAQAEHRSPGAPFVCAMYDTELFGHWWHEGPDFLAAVLDRAPDFGVTFASAGERAARATDAPRLRLPEGSWGAGGDHRVWMNADTAPLWTEVHAVERAFEAVARRAAARDEPVLDRVLTQAAREVLLLEASDWPFLVTHGAARDYAELRARLHAADARRLLALAIGLLNGGLDRAAAGGTSAALPPADRAFLAACEARDGPFPDLDARSGLAAVSAPSRAEPAPAGA